MVEDSTLTLLFLLLSKILTPPVEVKVAVLGLGVPYSVGFLNCFSAAIL